MGACSNKPQRKTKYKPNTGIWGTSTTASTEDINYFYKIISQLGKGSFGSVKLATYRQGQNDRREKKLFAIKTILKDRVKDKIYMLQRELEVLKTLDHPNIIKFYETYHDKMYIHFVMEYCPGGDLFEYVANKGPLEEFEAAQIMKKLFSAVAHIHSKNIVHRDLKPENILFTSKDKTSWDIKIIDFGLSRQFNSNDKKHMSVVGTPLYVAPEIIGEKNYEKECDNWSLGVIMYILLSGREPFYAKSLKEVYDKIRNQRYDFNDSCWENITKQAKDLISKLLTVDPKKRFTCEQALKHQWFSQFSENKDQKEIKKAQERISNLLSYNNSARFKKEVVKIFINHQIKQEELKEIESAFKMLDKDGNGELSFYELLDALKSQNINITEQELLRVINNVHDSNERNLNKLHVNYTEFIGAVIDWRSNMNDEKMWNLFKYFDVNNTGYITKESLKEVISREGRRMKNEDLEQMIGEIDQNKDGMIDFNDFKKMMEKDIENAPVPDVQIDEKTGKKKTVIVRNTSQQQQEDLDQY
ncbi:kinase domain protein (macronuclear) [Tetrahymena thermophila SB210]|uniref:non-specific serine/threonine protein kinase n=1 Tax=Tetrahymena thermophila (strain SB210) TaxID=312017 RepID=I7MMA8_TETTS|nr:kinase domain protein [Tetrahymena thermophila SB210]EAS04482.1 kinase domain protein [Tetrahymena thermophila SB210]|eukprot:XP_001024727.1 kinase domain protein [Tetrahymena thermophila SB210]